MILVLVCCWSFWFSWVNFFIGLMLCVFGMRVVLVLGFVCVVLWLRFMVVGWNCVMLSWVLRLVFVLVECWWCLVELGLGCF